MYSFGEASLAKLKTCDIRLQVVLNVAIKCSEIDFSVVDGFRDADTQNRYFADGKSQARAGESPHNFGYAVDLYPYPVDWSNMRPFHYLAGLLAGIGAAHAIPIQSGLFWKSFPDAPHHQLANWRGLVAGKEDSYYRHKLKDKENG